VTRYDIRYGKADVTVYRTYATPLRGIARIPESDFEGRDNHIFGARVEVEITGGGFLAAYTEGDNRGVVATDTMKNFVYACALEFAGSTLESFAAFVARRFLETWPHLGSLRVACDELPFVAHSDVLHARSRDDAARAEVSASRAGGVPTITEARSGRRGMRLVKLSGSSFARFVRDEYTTLPEMVDRPLFIHLDAAWRYADLAEATGERPARYVAPEQLRDLLARVFDEFNSRSIQHLVHEMGRRALERFPQLAEISFDAQNRLWDTALASDQDERVKVYTDPRATYGRIGLVMRRD
jgi:urate oxidase